MVQLLWQLSLGIFVRLQVKVVARDQKAPAARLSVFRRSHNALDLIDHLPRVLNPMLAQKQGIHRTKCKPRVERDNNSSGKQQSRNDKSIGAGLHSVV